ncbi:uncharacterized protein OCT59_001513 [Rhizophagus irregularis]|uniref:uncharacterized protein n=1 Tax=Rhizophagus irregularis TaxID=588596 RepID=UPI0019F082D4|nr:hypothetical protein OCT59_001513 [Rhizophagus irregularis]GET55834.1 hypothetical protein GLOIN_2v1777265 [Rhizophagus irregularis DAOM 181602=DAOM 197198]CAB4493273.1 unnamed protein product [Rhizophagus irregularis]
MSTYPASNIIVFDQKMVPTSKIFSLRFLNERRWELELGDVSRTFTNVSSFFLTVNLLPEHFERFDWDFT